jgi:hypothetical protein
MANYGTYLTIDNINARAVKGALFLFVSYCVLKIGRNIKPSKKGVFKMNKYAEKYRAVETYFPLGWLPQVLIIEENRPAEWATIKNHIFKSPEAAIEFAGKWNK